MGALSYDAVWRLAVCLTYVCLLHTSGLSWEQERPRKTKIGTEVAHVTRDWDTAFKVKRSMIKVTGGGGILWRPPTQLVWWVKIIRMWELSRTQEEFWQMPLPSPPVTRSPSWNASLTLSKVKRSARAYKTYLRFLSPQPVLCALLEDHWHGPQHCVMWLFISQLSPDTKLYCFWWRRWWGAVRNLPELSTKRCPGLE